MYPWLLGSERAWRSVAVRRRRAPPSCVPFWKRRRRTSAGVGRGGWALPANALGGVRNRGPSNAYFAVWAFVTLGHTAMLPLPVQGAFSKLTEALRSQPALAQTLHARWVEGGRTSRR